MSKGAQKARALAAKNEKRAASLAQRQVRTDISLLVDAFEEALNDFVLVVCDECGHEFAESSEFNIEGAILPCLLCGSERGHTSPRHMEVLNAVRARLAADRLTLSRVDAAA